MLLAFGGTNEAGGVDAVARSLVAMADRGWWFAHVKKRMASR